MDGERKVGTVSRGIRCPIIRQGDDLAAIVTESVLAAAAGDGFSLNDRDVVAVTESVVARAQGNYASADAIAADARAKLGGGTVGVLFPILSRNRFAVCLRGIAGGAKRIVLMLSYPSDEVGNEIVSLDALDAAGVDPYRDVLTLARFRELFGAVRHPFTGVDYVEYYQQLIRESGTEVEVIFANRPQAILAYADRLLTCDIHTRARTKRLLKVAGAQTVLGLDDIMTAPIDGSGYNENTACSAPTRRPRTASSSFRAPAAGWWMISSAAFLKRPAKSWRSWSTATALSRIPRAASGSWPTLSSHRPTPMGWSARPMS